MIPKNLKQLPREREDKTQFLWRRGYRISEFPTADCDRIELLFAMFNPILYQTKFIFRRKPSKTKPKMAGEPELTGLAKHFNSVTFTGRANVAKVIY